MYRVVILQKVNKDRWRAKAARAGTGLAFAWPSVSPTYPALLTSITRPSYTYPRILSMLCISVGMMVAIWQAILGGPLDVGCAGAIADCRRVLHQGR